MARIQTPPHLQREFECVYLIKHDIEDHAVDKIVEKYRTMVETNDGKVVGLESWGRRKLAYPIQKQRTANYIHMEFFGDDKIVYEVERSMRMTEDVVRWLTVVKNSHVEPESREKAGEMKRRQEPETEFEGRPEHSRGGPRAQPRAQPRAETPAAAPEVKREAEPKAETPATTPEVKGEAEPKAEAPAETPEVKRETETSED